MQPLTPQSKTKEVLQETKLLSGLGIELGNLEI